MSNPNGSLMKVQQMEWARLIRLLLDGVSATDAGEQLGVSRATIQRLKRDQDFQALYSSMKASRDARTEEDRQRAQDKIDTSATRIGEALEELSLLAANVLLRRLKENPDGESTRDIVGIFHIGVQRLEDVRKWDVDPSKDKAPTPQSPEEVAALLRERVPAAALKQAAGE